MLFAERRRLSAASTLLVLLSFVASTFPPTPARGQQSPLPTERTAINTYAITNARIVPVSGPAIARGTIVIRNGLIHAVGANVTAPPDARIIDGAGLNVYPGLIDANTSLGIPAATAQQRPPGAPGGGQQQPQQTTSFASPNSSQPVGLQPEILAADLIRPGGDQIEAARNAGITAALTSPREGIFIGQSAFINLAGATPQQMIVRSPVALHIGFTPLRTGEYPASLMGVFSAIRQMLLDAGRYRASNEIYNRNPRGVRRPDQDKSLAALLPVLAREIPVVMYANSEREINRALDLAQEFNLRAIIAGGEESWKVANRLRERDVPVLLSLNFPRRLTAPSPEADPETLRTLRARVEVPRTAGRLATAGVRFAFQSGGMTNMADFLTNVDRAAQNGLQRDAALQAMTIRPAEIFGLADRLGTIETGKIANLTVTRGDLFDSNRQIAHVFIDGRPVDLRPVTPQAGGAGASGTWTLSVNTGEAQAATITLTLTQQGTQLSGSIAGDLGSSPIANASIGAGGEIRFTAPVNIGGQTTEANFTGNVTGNEMRGAVQIVGREAGSFTGRRAGGTPPSTQPGGGGTPPPTGTQTTATDLTGTWAVSVSDPEGGPIPVTLTLNQQGQMLTGNLQSPFGAAEIANGSAGTDGFRFTVTITIQGQTVEVALNGTARGNEMSGTATLMGQSIPFTGTRTP
jgi:imidazolonepropionase-like amidohydrolase